MGYSSSEVKINALKYFKGDELATDVWIRKYCLKDELTYYELTPDDMHRRIAKELARIENKYPNPLKEDEIYNTIKEFKRIIPQGSPMSGIGNDLQIVSLSNCFVVGNRGDGDSYGGIMKLDQEIVQLQKRRGGVGLDLSFIRPSGSPVKNSAITSTGIVPFMERFSNSTKEVAQDGRRGALMESISIKHPDAELFIDAKLSAGKVTGANVSVKITDEFMKAVVENKPFIQQYPIDSDNPTYVKEIDAKKLWKKIIYNAWKSAEPGILFWDTIINESIPDCYGDLGFKTTSTNPCFPSSEYLLTESGYYRFGDLVKNNPSKINYVVCDKRISYVDDGYEKSENWKIDNNQHGTVIREASNVFLTQTNAEIIEIKTSKGFKLRCTPDHHIATTMGMVEAKDLTYDDRVLISIPNNSGSIIGKTPETTLEMLGFLLGLNQGGGTLDKKRNRIHFDLCGYDAERLKILICNVIDKLYNNLGENEDKKNNTPCKYYISLKEDKIRISSAWIGKVFEEYGFDFNNKFHIPEFILNNSSNNVGKFYIAGLMYCGGSIQVTNKGEYSISLSQSDEDFLNKIQLILHSNGLIFEICERHGEKLIELSNGDDDNPKNEINYELIGFNESVIKYTSSIGFLGDTDRESGINTTHNYQINKSFTDNVIEIKQLKNESVFCLKEDIGRNIIVNGISVRRCGEIPLCPDDSCRLLALNLYGYVVNPFQSNAYFDWDLFKSDVIKAQRYMDDIIDLEIEKIDAILRKIESDPEDEFIKLYEIALWERIKRNTTEGRRTGLGITAEGDMIAALNMIYGTDEATDFSEIVHKCLKLEAYRSSVIMAKERGAFPLYDVNREINNPFIIRISNEDPELYGEMVKYGRRNIALLTLAPTGTVSLMTQTTSGIENCFLVAYTRRRKINPQEGGVRVDFVDDEGVSWQEYPVFHHKFETWLEVNGYDLNEVKSMTINEVNEIVKKSPYYKATANDVNWVKKVEMQGRIQKHIDHSISTTINLPNDITEDMVSLVYETGWRVGCKGITVYRDGSRSGILVSDSDKKELEIKELFQDTHAPKRPKRLNADIVRFQNNLEKWIAVVGLLDGRPYEIFVGKLGDELLNLPQNIKECEIVKNIVEIEGVDGKIKKKRYDVEYVDGNGEKHTINGLNYSFNPEYWNYAKLISGILRHGMPLVYVYELVNSLNLRDDVLNTWKNGIARVIKRYIKDGERGKGRCSTCGGENLEFIEGCLTCKSCGDGRCG